ncbi:MAG: hypothetical protein ACI4EJ_06430 [Bacteroides sp.]
MNTLHGNPLQLGVTKTDNGYNFAVRSFAGELTLEIYEKNIDGSSLKPLFTVNLDESFKYGDIFSVKITGADLKDCFYRYMCDKGQVLDDYAKTLSGCGNFGEIDGSSMYLSRVELEEFDWQDDRCPRIPFNECIMYKLHVRGFTKSRTSGVSAGKRGTFAGIIEKIPYLKSLGVTTIELMPAYEFDEAHRFEDGKISVMPMQYPDNAKKTGINYWGYSKGAHFAPKASYSRQSLDGDSIPDYSVEFKKLVRELHANGMEVIMEMYFTHEESYMIRDCLRYWVTEYHIDGVHIYCDESALCAATEDPLLGNTKIITVYWNGAPSANGVKHIANYNTGFDEVAKRLLKGDENQLQRFVQVTRANPSQSANINYVTNHNGFTMMDLVSYDRKHNDDNGESNRDGENFNYSWNCGVEGPSKKKKINELRLGQIKNAFMMLLTAQGTPLILAGDEFGNAQSGNNNPYCLDNEITWLEWKNTAMSSKITEFVKELTAFRKSHPILHAADELTASDGLACGYPDVSYHSDNAWFSRMESFERCIGIMYCGEYVKNDRRNEVIYIAYNLHWEEHKLALPDIPDKESWTVALSTSTQVLKPGDREFTAPPRSITILTGRLADNRSKLKETKNRKNTKNKKKRQ